MGTGSKTEEGKEMSWKFSVFYIFIYVISLFTIYEQAPLARVVIDVDVSDFQPYPLAIAPPKKEGDIKDEFIKKIDKILLKDMKFAGFFNILDRKSFLADLEKEGLSINTIDFQDWINIGAEGLIKCIIRKKEKGFELECRLFEVATMKEALRYKKEFDREGERAAVHSFSSKVVEYYTGVPGIYNTKIAYIKKISGRYSVCVSDFDGYNEHVVLKNGSINLFPSWFPDLKRLLLTSYRSGIPELYVLNIKTKRLRRFLKKRYKAFGGQVSEDGRFAVVTINHGGDSDIYIIDNSGIIKKRLTKDWFIDTSPTLSPDDKKIAFVSNRPGTPQIYVMNIDGTGLKRLTFQGNYNTDPQWSPRGDLIAFTARDERRIFDIFTVNVETGEIKRITQDQGNNEDPSWSPDGRHLVFSSDRSGIYQLYVSNFDGSVQIRITDGRAEHRTPSWSTWPED